jgi:hypothetical protein
MAQYSYDDNGAYFNYFLLSFLMLFLFPTSYYAWFPKKSDFDHGLTLLDTVSASDCQYPVGQRKQKYLQEK